MKIILPTKGVSGSTGPVQSWSCGAAVGAVGSRPFGWRADQSTGVGGSGSVGGDDDLAEGALAEGVEGGLRLVQREDLLDGHGCLAAGQAVADPVEHLAGGVGVYRDHGRCLGGHLVRALHEGGEEPAAVTDQFDNARVPGEVGEDVDPVRCYRADLGGQVTGVVDCCLGAEPGDQLPFGVGMRGSEHTRLRPAARPGCRPRRLRRR